MHFYSYTLNLHKQWNNTIIIILNLFKALFIYKFYYICTPF